MIGIGGAEILIIVVMALVIFGGPAVIGFWLGYQAGRKAADSDSSSRTEQAVEPDQAEEIAPNE